jgi:maleylacetate reductase
LDDETLNLKIRMISNFTYHSDPIRIVFGAGAVAALRDEIEFHKISRLVVLCSPTRADFARRVTAPVADRCVGFCHTAGQHMPHEAFEHIIGDEMNWNAVEFKS